MTFGGVELDENGKVKTTTVNGKNVPIPHAYNEEDMKGTIYQNMLPVDVINYTPPTAVVFVLDHSMSMNVDSAAGSFVDTEIEAAIACLDVLSTRDYVGIVVLEDNYKDVLELIPMTQKKRAVKALRDVASGSLGGTRYETAIRRAGQYLSTFDLAERKHIVFISDGAPADKFEVYGAVMKDFNDNFGITATVCTIGGLIPQDMQKLAEVADGHAYAYPQATFAQKIPEHFKEDLGLDEEKSGFIEEEYTPKLTAHTPIVDKISQLDLDEITMTGFFETRAKGTDAVVVSLMASYAPLYAQWDYGAGKVGSFLCDLNNRWSKEFSDNDTGQDIVNNMVNTLMPVIVVHTDTFEATIIEDNYRTQVNVYSFEEEKNDAKKFVAFVTGPSENGETKVEKFDLKELSISGNRFVFENLTPGVYTITILEVSSRLDFMANRYQSYLDLPSSDVFNFVNVYRNFSFSKEYDPTLDPFEDGKNLLINLSTRETENGGEEKFVYEASEIVSRFSNIEVVINPRIWLISLSIVLLMLDIIVRKFKLRLPKWLAKRKVEVKN